MQLIGLTGLLRESAVYRGVVAQLQQQDAQTLNVLRSARPFLLATLTQDWDGAILYLTARSKRAYTVAEQLPVWLEDESRIHRFAEPTPMFYDRLPWDTTIIRERLETLHALLFAEETKSKPIVIASARALIQRTLPVNQFRRQTQTLKIGDRYQVDVLIQSWLELGYEPATMVSETGTFARRGGILDIFPLASDLPIRIEFFDDELDTFRKFNPATQRTVETLQEITIIPAREALPQWMPQAAHHLETWFDSVADSADVSSLQQDYESMLMGQAFPYLEHYLPYVVDTPVSILDYAPQNTLVVVDDLDDLESSVSYLIDEAQATRETNQQTNQLPDDFPVPYIEWETIVEDLARAITLNLTPSIEADSDTFITRLFRPVERFGGQLRPTLNYIREQHQSGAQVVTVTQQVPRLENLWYEQDASAYLPKAENILTQPQGAYLEFVTGELTEGWTLETSSQTLHLITDREIFGWSRPEPRRRKAGKRGTNRLPETDYADWHDGDYVVHVDYGIGRFKGMEKRTMDGTEREYLLVEYAKNGMLYVPIHQSDRLTRYVGPNENPPKLNTMGKQDTWTRTKEKAKKNALEEAKELLEIYAQRAKANGFHYAPDTAWQHELEASFPYVETDDQLSVIRDIKSDMESSLPMDRLVCGDVGYGKTEVALRVAFKAVMDGKQVAVLVPTTVLANQHFETFRRRMDQFPVKIEMLSRFRTKAEQSNILTELANGKVDIIIGTHRILSKDIVLENLGLIIIDEEQRFGVKHKEHFKKLRANVDILTLTATPIPRTLYMSMSGVRDISMLQTAPEDRVPVITHVGAFDEKLSRQAILREIDRGGQVFVIHNRIKSIDVIREKLEQLVPEASIVIAHGQMSGRQLEQKISAFSKGEYDILLATSIIENGIDMPNVNTLIVDRADWFGMAQLYQIRGRVGRSATQAYAYFFHGGGKKLNEEARARLETLAEYTELGSGFQISVRDLELRGAGDILSMKQTGHVALVGLQLYTQLLQQAVSELKGDVDSIQPTYAKERVIIDLPLPAYIPSDWISEMALRLQLYRRIGSMQTLDDVEQMAQELRDRFGVLPIAVEGLLYQIQVKLLATSINATAVVKPRDHILIKVPWLMAVDREALALQLGEDIEVSRTAVEIAFDDDLWQLRLLDVLKELKAGVPEQVGV